MNQIKLFSLLLLLFVLTSLSGCSHNYEPVPFSQVLLTFQYQHFTLTEGRFKVEVRFNNEKPLPSYIYYYNVDLKNPNAMSFLHCSDILDCRFAWGCEIYDDMPSEISVLVTLQGKTVFFTSFKPNSDSLYRRFFIPTWE